MPDGDERMVDALVIGTGAAGVAAAKALKRRGASFAVVDVANDIEPSIQGRVAALAEQDPSAWSEEDVEALFPAPKASADGVERRLLFGSDFPYRVARALSVATEACATEITHAFGGFGNVWGAASLPYSDRTLSRWPIDVDALKASYRNVLDYMPLSAEADGLAEDFPLFTDDFGSLKRSEQAEALLSAMARRSDALARRGVRFGRARLAVDSASPTNGCRYCGFCLDGCAYGALFTPQPTLRALEAEGTPFHRGRYALELAERDGSVELTTLSTTGGAIEVWRAKRVYLACGYLETTRLLARSLGRLNEPIRISDSQYFFFPFLSYRGRAEDHSFALADAFVELDAPDVCPDDMHFQIYGMNRIFAQALRGMVPRPAPIGPLAARFYMVQGFLPAASSGHLELTIAASRPDGDDIMIRGVENPEARRVAAKGKAAIRNALLHFGVAPPVVLKMMPPGRSFHAGASFPMGGDHAVFASDDIGRPAGLKRVHIVDSACFPSIASSTIGLTIMANADRIATATRALDDTDRP